MKIKSLTLLCMVGFLSVGSVDARSETIWPLKGKKKKQEVKIEETKKVAVSSPYATFIKSTNKFKGVVTVHLSNDGRCQLEIPASLLGKPMMLSSKISESSNSSAAMAGSMIDKPLLMMFTCDNDVIILRHLVSNTEFCEGQDEVNKAIKRNNITPAAEQFKIMHKSPKDSSYVIDVTSFMTSTAPGMGIVPDMMAVMSGAPKLSPNQSLCAVIGAKAFERNVNIKVRLAYREMAGTPFEATVTRSLILLPDAPMKGRVLDPRMNYFRSPKYVYDMNKDKGEEFEYIHRWNLQPKPEDVERYRKGELVEPQKPIVYYVDDALPEKWRKYIKQGIEDWQIGFESIGFKNAIIAKDFPKNDPNFDPEDIRYSCFRYITVPIANAMGPSWVDPRSGEIIQGSVYFYHNVIQLVHNWMFTQTAACDPKVRALTFDEETMGRALRYIAAHEIGHTLGLMHNMKASAAYPVDSLRSATFTQKYGTTASIMDYARFNYVAQPGDKGVSFCPPLLGEYDKFSLKVGYTPIFEKDEKAVIKKWFDEKKGIEMFVYGPQAMSMPIDPSAQTEDLGNDPVKASRYGIKNLKYIFKNLMDWSKANGSDLNDLQDIYGQLKQQYNNHFSHVLTVIGGAYLYQPELADDQPAYVPVSKAKQKEAVDFLLNETIELPKWFVIEDVKQKYGPVTETLTNFQTSSISMIMEMASRVDQTNSGVKGGYSGSELIEDVYKFVWSSARKQDRYQRNMEYNYVKNLMVALGYISAPAGGSMMGGMRGYGVTDFDLGRGEYLVNATSIPASKEKASDIVSKQVYFAQLNRIRNLAQSRIGGGNVESSNHYKYLVHEIDKALKK